MKKRVKCETDGNSVYYSFYANDPFSIHLNFEFSGKKDNDMIMISQTEEWIISESKTDQIVIKNGRDGLVTFQKKEMPDKKVSYIFSTQETGDAYFSSEFGALQGFAQKGFGSGHMNLNRLNSGLLILAWNAADLKYEDVMKKAKAFSNPMSYETGEKEKNVLLAVTIGEEEIEIEIETEGRQKIDFLKELQKAIEEANSEEITMSFKTLNNQKIKIRKLEVTYQTSQEKTPI